MSTPSGSKPLLRRWWFRWLVLPIALLVVAHACWTLALKWRFEARIEELRAAGEPVGPRDLAPQPVPDEDNAAPLLNEAHRWYEANVAGDEPFTLTWQDEEWMEEYRDDVLAWLARSDPYVELLARAAERPMLQQDLDWEAGANMQFVTIPAMANASLVLSRRMRAQETASPQALRELALLCDLAAKVEHQALISTLVRWTLHAAAADALQELARKPGFDAVAARALLGGRLAATDDRDVLRDSLRGERVLHLDTCRRWIGGESPRQLLRAYSIMEPETRKQPFLDGLLGSWIVRPLAYRDALQGLDLFDEALELVELPPWEALPRAKELRERYDTGLPSVFSGLCAKLPPKAVLEWQRHAARVRVARVGLALLELRQETGAWPESLDAVVPLVGADTLVDPFNGARLRYAPGEILEADAPIPIEDLREDDEIVWRFHRGAGGK